MHFAMMSLISPRGALAGALLLVACPGAFAQSAYITQVSPHAPVIEAIQAAQPTQTVPVSQYGPNQTAFVPTPELTQPRNGNVASTLQIGSFNRVYQSQSGGGNFSNVGIVGGNSNNVGVWQGGRDLSNLALINMQGFTVDVLQPPGAAPINMLIARLPNGGLLIKR
ncbi:hypothetical protein [Bradyrhizobium sp.]|uniref:hypothetical protein n=1 Tax=Bradyrhizobium sp. TaxID=376 RepID=UPI003C6FC5E3